MNERPILINGEWDVEAIQLRAGCRCSMLLVLRAEDPSVFLTAGPHHWAPNPLFHRDCPLYRPMAPASTATH